MRLRGFDEYEITLGDEMRGYRATLGKTFAEVETDLRIRAKVIRAIEDCDLDGFPNASVVPGYVRSYARYLGMDADDCYAKFCATSGYRSPAAAFDGAMNGGRKGAAAAAGPTGASGPMDGSLTESRFALPPAPARLGWGINLGGIMSVLALAGLIGGLGYGGYALLQDLQRVGFAPLPQAPEVVAEAPAMGLPQADAPPLQRPNADAYQGDGVLAAFAPADLAPPPMPTRDGPISAIDPATTGVFAAASTDQVPSARSRIHPAGAAPVGDALGGALLADAGGGAAGATIASAGGGAAPGPTPDAATASGQTPAAGTDIASAAADKVVKVADAGPPHVFIHATAPAWIRIRDADDAVLFQGVLSPGQRYEVPARSVRPVLRAGNAGSVYLMVGKAAYGPLGGPGGVAKNVSLEASDIAKQLPQAGAGVLANTRAEAGMQRAEATISQ